MNSTGPVWLAGNAYGLLILSSRVLDAVGTVKTPGGMSHSGPRDFWLCERLLVSRTGQKRGERSFETGLQPARLSPLQTETGLVG